MSSHTLSDKLIEAGFFDSYWQRRPLLVRNAGINLPEQLDKQALFEHAGDQRLAARLVQGHVSEPGSWTVSHGPFANHRLRNQPQNNWTLLIQDLDKVRDDCAALLEQFNLLPRWRLDDVMASYAVPGGSVGPHTDQYDVFLIQLHGQRRWQWTPDYNEQWLPELELKVLQQFEPQHDQLLGPGDMLYLPPGVAHFGVAETECITISVGLRAPSAAELINGLTEHGLAADLRYRDPDLSATEQNQLGTAVADRIREQLRRLLAAEDAELLDSFGQYITEYRLAEDLLTWPDLPAQLPEQYYLIRQPAARLTWRELPDEPETAVLYCNGNYITCATAAARLICNQPGFNRSQLQQATSDSTGLTDWLLEHAGFYLSAGEATG